jgi:LacI family transcriptional regulator, repressor for deo operon, udp, cdd, tsx, nupC, and nupG
MAMGAIRLLSERGIRVPDHISVTGFDDIAISKYLAPSLTTIAQPAEMIGNHVMMLLDQVMNGKKMSHDTVLSTEIILRESTAAKRQCLS